MDEEKILSAISDGNVEKLRRANDVLGKPPWTTRSVRSGLAEEPRPGSRPDGGMAAKIHESIIKELTNQVLQHEAILQNNLADARRMIDAFEEDQLRLEDEVRRLKATLEEERNQCAMFQNRCEELKNVLRSAAEIMVNGEKARA